jgi:hypothetical protein
MDKYKNWDYYFRGICLEMNLYAIESKKGFFNSIISSAKMILTDKKTFLPFNVLDIYYAD